MRPLLLSMIVTVSLAGCPKKPATPNDWPDDPTDEAHARASCEAASKALSVHKCKEAREDFADFCVYEFQQDIPLHPQCLAQIASCDDVDKCR